MGDSITGASAEPGDNDNGREVVEFFVIRGICVGNMYFEHRSFNKYTKVASG